jgi:CIC family chloride channel protein
MELLPRLRRFLPERHGSQLLAAAIAVGVAVGFLVALFDAFVVEVLLHNLLDLPLAVQVVAPLAGLLITVAILKYAGGDCSPSTSDEYIYAFHSRKPEVESRPLAARLAAGGATIGMGGALGLEGPSIYLGSSIGLAAHQRLERWMGRDGAKLLLTAGAAAGVSALFQAPATGLIFALESPYRDDVVHRALLPSLMASAASYLTFVFMPFVDAHSTLGFNPQDAVGPGDLLGAVAIGVGAGLGGRWYAWTIRWAKSLRNRISPWLLAVGGGVILGALALVAEWIFDEPLTLGPGLEIVDWLEGSPTLLLITALFFFRGTATVATIGAGGVGGLFIPLAIQGVLLGRLVGDGLQELGWAHNATIWPFLGLAAFLAAGYRTPIAAVMFVAESSRGAAVVPALVAAAVSQLVAGPASVSAGQRVERLGHLEERLTLPISSALTTDVMTVPSDATVSEFMWVHAIGRRQRAVPVVDGAEYLGLCSVSEAAGVTRDDWETTPVSVVMDAGAPTARPSWRLRDAMAAMDRIGVDQIAVTDESGGFVGVVYESEIVKLGEILDQTEQ